MYFEDATRKQLLTIALYDDCDMDYKYQACRELQIRKWHDDMLPHLVLLWGKGYSIYEISAELGIPETTVRSRLIKHNLYGKRVKANETVY